MLYSSVLNYKNKADRLGLADTHYWHILLHANGDESEIDDPNFFFAPDGKTNPKAELHATLDAFFSDEKKDDNSSICRFPARYRWLKKQLNAKDFPQANCVEYKRMLKRVDPHSVTLVFPAAHINSPASMFGHTFLRINSSYNSRLLSYAINYAADADMKKENGFLFAVKGLFGGYFGRYSLLPYYDKLKEYRDSEQRDIWEYNLDLTQKETERMFRHIWELKDTHSYYYFFTENCSYNMLWLLEAGREGLDLRKHFTYQVIPLETVHAAKSEYIITADTFRPSKRTKLLRYEEVIDNNNEEIAVDIVDNNKSVDSLIENEAISLQQKRFILEASIEYLEYRFIKGKVKKERYLDLFHKLTTYRSKLGRGEDLNINTPTDPILGHRAIRIEAGGGIREEEGIGYLGIRPAYHDLSDSDYGFLRGTQIEFMDLLLAYTQDEVRVERATIFSLVSLSQRSTFFPSFSWRTKFGWDTDYLSEKAAFNGDVGIGLSWGNKFAYTYFLVDPLFYVEDSLIGGVGGSIGINIDKYKFMNTNIELSHRFYTNGEEQTLAKLSQGFRLSQNMQIMLHYDYKDKKVNTLRYSEDTYNVMLRYYY